MFNGEEIRSLIKKKRLVENFIDLETQLAPNGFDLTVGNMFYFKSQGSLDFSNKERVISKEKEIMPIKKKGEKYGWWNLKRGVYKIKTNEIINLPANMVGISFPRSSVLRMGGSVHTGVWDAGFSGKGEFVLSIGNLSGMKIRQNARIIQLIFLRMNETKNIYNGIYKNLK